MISLLSYKPQMDQENLANSSDGFTIVELMIALTIMSIILVISTIVLIQIGGLYDKGVSGSNLQNTARAIVSDVSSGIQFSGYNPAVRECSPYASQDSSDLDNDCFNPNEISPNPDYPYTYNDGTNTPVYEYAYCIGTTRYSYILNVELGTDSSVGTTAAHVLWRDSLSSVNDLCAPVDMSNPGSDPNTTGDGYEMMSDHTRLTDFSITPASGTGSSDVYNIAVNSAFGDSNLFDVNGNCKSQIGLTSTEFCSTSSISSTVEGRVY